MLKNLDFRYDGRKCYSVVFTDSYLKLTDSFNGIETCGRKLCIVSDSEKPCIKELQNTLTTYISSAFQDSDVTLEIN
jgi:hypothetical protein